MGSDLGAWWRRWSWGESVPELWKVSDHWMGEGAMTLKDHKGRLLTPSLRAKRAGQRRRSHTRRLLDGRQPSHYPGSGNEPPSTKSELGSASAAKYIAAKNDRLIATEP